MSNLVSTSVNERGLVIEYNRNNDEDFINFVIQIKIWDLHFAVNFNFTIHDKYVIKLVSVPYAARFAYYCHTTYWSYKHGKLLFLKKPPYLKRLNTRSHGYYQRNRFAVFLGNPKTFYVKSAYRE